MAEVLELVEGKCWEVYVDKANNAKGAGVDILFFNTEREMIKQSVMITFLETNNVVEYEVVLLILKELKEL